MKRLLPFFVVPVLFLLSASPADDAEGPLSQLDWLSGRWVKEGNGQYIEETWSPAKADAMVGSFRWARGGKVWLYELMSIEVEGDAPVFRLRHFNRGLAPWKSEADGPLTYPLLSMTENEIVFENPERDSPRRFVYHREGDALAIRLENPDGDGDEFRFKLDR